MSSNVTVFIEVYNEEHRIETCLRSFSWADEIIVFDKHSSDSTAEIASRYAKVILVPFGEASENVVKNVSNHNSREWCLFPTASSLMHPKLAQEIVKLTSDKKFNFDVIGMPYAMYSFGICHKRSPFYADRKYTLIRRSVLRVSNKLHREITYETDKIYDMPILNNEAKLYHCTHKDIDSYLEQLVRYTKYEVAHDPEINKKKALIDLIRVIAAIVFRKKTFLLGYDGVALSLNLIIYYAVRYLRVWDTERENGNVIYNQIRDKIEKELK